MSDLQETKDIIVRLTKKVDYEAKFTRTIVVVCCLAIMASTFYSLTAIVEVLPDLIFTKFLGNIDRVQQQWHSLDKHAALREQSKQ